MTLTPKLINLGAAAGDTSADPRRTGGVKINENFALTQVHDKTLNAGYFKVNPNTGADLGLTKEQAIQAAITYAAANGFTAVWVPASMLPYDASAVTFNTGVHMLREGGPTVGYDVIAYGAGGGADWEAFHAAEVATQIAGNTQLLRVPTGNWNLSKPLLAQSAGRHLTIAGEQESVNANTGTSNIRGTFAGGPIIVGTGTATVSGLVTSLVTGAGQAWNPTTNTYWFNLRDLDTCDLNGLGTFAVECFYRGTGNAISWIASGGQWLLSDSFNNCFALGKTDAGATARFHLKTTNNTVDIAGGVVNDGGTHHVAGTYDGTTARLFVDGVMVASAGATGTLVQHVSEDVTLGTLMQRTPDAAILNSILGTYDSVRLSDTARYTSGFTAPTAKFTSDGNTLALVNFDGTIGTCVQAYNKNGTCWLQQRANTATIPGSGGLFLRNLTLSSGTNGRLIGWLIGNESYNWGADAVQFFGCRVGMYAPKGDVYGQSVKRIYMNASNTGRFGIMLGSNGFINHLDTVWLQGYQVGLLPLATQAMTCTNLEVEGSTQTVFGVMCRNDNSSNSPLVLNGCTIRTEGGVSSAYRAAIGISGITLRTAGIVATGCVFETGNNAPFVIGDTLDAGKFVGCNFVKNTSPTVVMHAQGTFTRPVVFDACDQPNGWLPWSDVPGTAVVGQLGKLTTIAFSTPLTIDCSLRDDIELAALTGAITINFSNVTPGQKISLWTVQNAGGGNSITFGTVNSTGAVKGATANDTTASHWTQYVFDMNLAGNLTQVGFNSGA